jgi:alpha-beta hydrolase superfamily lysophospholipase
LLSALTPNFANIWTAIMYYEYSQYDQKDLPYKGKPTWIKIHPSYLPTIAKALDGDVEPDTLARNPQSLKKYALKPIVNRLQTTTTNWAVIGEKFKADNLFWTHTEPQVQFKDTFDMHARKARAIARYAAGPKSGLNYLLVGS